MISKDTFIMFAMKAYDNPSCKTIYEFENDVAQFNLLSRLCKKEVSDDITPQILNQVISLFNVFEYETCIKMMFHKVKKENWPQLKTILVYLNRMPERIDELNLINSDIPICNKMINILRTL